METPVLKDVANATINTYVAEKNYTANIKGFTYKGDYAFLVVNMNGKNEQLILGEKAAFPIRDVIALKGLSADFTFKRMQNVNGNDYPRFNLDCINM